MEFLIKMRKIRKKENFTAKETTPASGTRDQKCKNESNCKSCGNYEAWKSGSNYKNK